MLKVAGLHTYYGRAHILADVAFDVALGEVVVLLGRNSLETSVRTIMSAPVIGIDERRPITEAADLMDKHRTLHLGVTKGGPLIGLVSVRDFLRPVSIDEF